MLDFLSEIGTALSANKLRTCLTGFAVSWGIFMLILLLAAGNGLKNGVMSNFFYMSKNTISLYPGTTSKPFAGMSSGRSIIFSPDDVEYLQKEISSITDVVAFTPIYNMWNCTTVYNGNEYDGTLSGVKPGYEIMRSLRAVSGRLLNVTDEHDVRKVIIMHERTAKTLFGTENPIGKYVMVSDIPFIVVGIYAEAGESFRPSLYIPYTTATCIFNPSGKVTDISFLVNGVDDELSSKILADRLKQIVANRMIFDPEDQQALFVSDRITQSMQSQTIFSAINLFIWIIGIGTLVASIVGVSNIMLVTVRERTHEIGIRKAIGASPASILWLIVSESLSVTLIFGYVGMFLGIAVSELVAKILDNMPKQEHGISVFMNPTVDLGIVVTALMILVVAGVVAGYVPANKAVRIKPIEAMMAK